MKWRTLTVGTVVGALALAGCGKSGSPGEQAALSYPVASNVQVADSPTFAKMKQRGHIVMGVKDDQPGMGAKDPVTGTYSGFDIEIGRLVAAGLGFDPSKIEYKVVQSAGREQAIENGDVDYYVGSYTINAKRKERVGFAGPSIVIGQDLLVRKDDNSITGPETLKGKKVCSVTGSTPIQNVRDKQLTEPSNIVEFGGYSQCVDKLLSNQGVDVVTTDDAILKGYAAQDPDKLRVVGKPFTVEPEGVGVPKNDKALRLKIDDILQAALTDGTWQKIYDSTLGKSGAKVDPDKMPKIDRYQ